MNKYCAGAISGLSEVILTHPLDYIKTRRQEYIQNNLKLTNFYKEIYNGNVRSFYTGIFSRLVGIVPMRMIFWGVQSSVNEFLKLNNIKTKFNFIIIGTLGGISQSLIDNQIELFKIGKITSKKIGINDIIKFKGLAPTLYRNVIFANFMANSCFNLEFNNSYEKFKYSSCTGIIASIVTQPIDYVKTIKHRRELTYYKGKNITELSTFKILKLIGLENPRLLFTGVLLRSALSFFTMGIGFVVFDNLI